MRRDVLKALAISLDLLDKNNPVVVSVQNYYYELRAGVNNCMILICIMKVPGLL
jgi:hypothetical protein